MALALLLLALLGHAVLWVALVNRLHTVPMPEGTLTRVTYALLGVSLLMPLAYWHGPACGSIAVLAGTSWLKVSPAGAAYLGICWAAAAVALLDWLVRHVCSRPPSVLRWRRSRIHDSTDGWAQSRPQGVEDEHHRLTRLPGNQMLVIDVAERGLEVARLPAALEGLRIAHLSDLHYSGAIGKSYFQEVVRLSNAFAPDLTVVTGDLVDNDQCIAWLPDTLGRLTARYGVFYVLGNHDLWIDTVRLRLMLDECGLQYLGGRWRELTIADQPLLLAGNERPWASTAADLAAAPGMIGGLRPLRIALSHSPDELDWARRHDVDLLLAGHTHGGQVRLPWIGPILSPSRKGVKYASGTFHAPPTVMHVSRGISGKFPLRLNCPPELCLLVLHRPAGG